MLPRKKNAVIKDCMFFNSVFNVTTNILLKENFFFLHFYIMEYLPLWAQTKLARDCVCSVLTFDEISRSP